MKIKNSHLHDPFTKNWTLSHSPKEHTLNISFIFKHCSLNFLFTSFFFLNFWILFYLFIFTQQVLISYPFYTCQCIHVNLNLPVHLTTTPLSPPGVHTFVVYICGFFLIYFYDTLCFFSKLFSKPKQSNHTFSVVSKIV